MQQQTRTERLLYEIRISNSAVAIETLQDIIATLKRAHTQGILERLEVKMEAFLSGSTPNPPVEE